MDDEQIKKNADFLVSNLSGKEIPGSVKLSVRYKTLVDFAKVYGITDPKYTGSEEEGIVACHAFANNFTIKALYKLLLGMKLIQDGKERPFILNPGKLLHAGQKYDWDECVDAKPGDKLEITAKWGKAWVIEKNMIFFADLHVEVKNQNGEMVVKPTVTAAIRPGGY
ncbi:MAG: MaoC family dehydratase N-terminal domain-containing protein [Candidatus Thorarchaeota archaeon]